MRAAVRDIFQNMRAHALAVAAVLLCVGAAAGCAAGGGRGNDSPGRRAVLFSDDFRGGLANWVVELERGGAVTARDGRLDVDVPGECTVWFRHRLEGPVVIEYEATAVSAGGANDRVSDLNCFWMARDARSPGDLFATRRGGTFAEYNWLRCYYVGLGGNGNTTTRFRRYVGDPDHRPLLPEHDLRGTEELLVANRAQVIRLVACGEVIRFERDGRRVFEMRDAEPYRSGWFGLRTTQSHLSVRNFRVYRISGEAGARCGNL
jgi:hypothetical protein